MGGWTPSAVTREFADWIIREDHEIVTSSLTVGEILIHPSRASDGEMVRRYAEALGALEIRAFDVATARVFAELRARTKGLRPPDAIQLACAIVAEADVFVTNDTRLKNVPTPGRMGSLALAEWRTLYP